MQSAYIINDRTGKPYAVVGILAGGTEFYPIADSAVSWSSWMTQDFASKKITKEQLTVTLDNSMSVEGPMPANRANKPKIDELIKKAKKVPKGESDKEEMEQTEEKSLVPVLSLMDVRLDALENSDWRNAVNFKAKSLITDSTKSTFAYEVKRTRAAWDPGLSIPGTERRGGWRCPPGTRYGGQITDRFGRNCGWGVSRRLANEISDLGERLENVGDQRRERRVNRRNERVARRLAEGGRVERAARAVGNALETGPERERRPGVVERAAGRLGDLLETTAPGKPNKPGRQRRGENNRGGLLERAAGRLAEALESDDSGKPSTRRPSPGLDGGGQGVRPVDGDIVPARRPSTPRRPKAPQARPASPRKPRNTQERPDGLIPFDEFVPGMQPDNPNPRRRRPPRMDNVSKTPVPVGGPQAGETLEQYKTRKYNEHQRRVREIRDAGGNAGLLRRAEWEEFHGPAIEENWNRAQQRNAGRGARRAATDAGAARTATRRPKPADEPDAVQPPRRQRKPFNAPGQRGYPTPERARQKREELLRDNPNKEYQVIKYDGKYYAVERMSMRQIDDINDNGGNIEVVPDATPSPSAPSTPSAPPAPRTPRTPAGGGPRPLNRLNDRHEEKVLPRLADKDAKFEEVAVGNKGINNATDAENYTGPISDVPDEFLGVAINAKSADLDRVSKILYGDSITREQRQELNEFHGRIKKARTQSGQLTPEDKEKLKELRENGVLYYSFNAGSQGANPSFHLLIAEDGSLDGRGYLLKPPDTILGEGAQHAELMGFVLAERMGFAAGQGRIIPNRSGNAPDILIELGPNFADGQAENVGNIAQGANAIQDAESRLGMALLNGIVGATDRHPGNGMVFEGNGALPIDFGRAFYHNPNTPRDMIEYIFDNEYSMNIDRNPLKGYMDEYAAKVASGMTPQQAKDEIRESLRGTLSAWANGMRAPFEDGTFDALQQRIPRGGGTHNVMVVPQRNTAVLERIQVIESDEFLDALVGRF
jgi:hypothetical protein